MSLFAERQFLHLCLALWAQAGCEESHETRLLHGFAA